MRSSSGKQRLTNLIAPLKSAASYLYTKSGVAKLTQRWQLRTNPLLNISIGRRLALGFFIPALIAVITLSNEGIQSQQRLLQESSFYQANLDAYTSLTEAVNLLQQINTNSQEFVAYAAQPKPLPEILSTYQSTIQKLSTQLNTIYENYLHQDLIGHYPELIAIFTEAGYGAQIEEQLTYSEEANRTWQAYRHIQDEIFTDITAGNLDQAQTMVTTEAKSAYSDAVLDLQTLIKHNESLVPSLQVAATIEVHKLVISTIIAVLIVLVGIGLVGWIVSKTLVRRLKRLRSVVQAIEKGQVDARLDTRGRDEIADVSQATNAMLDTLVGLLEETKRQRDELASAQELQKLHDQLQKEHEALNEANARLATLAITDPLTNLPNHRAVVCHIEEELSMCRRTQDRCALMFLDIDHFKHINDTWGHQSGDAVLRMVGDQLKKTLPVKAFAGRYGGEEFVVVMKIDSNDEAKLIAQNLRLALAEQPCIVEIEEDGKLTKAAIPITASIGVAVYREHGATREELIEAADQAMYCAKRSGRNRMCFADEDCTSVQPLFISESGIPDSDRSVA
jgi:diguanylate cyclase (GGDEF)-like protein